MNIHGDLKSLLLFWENLASNRRYRHYLSESDFQTFRERADNEGLPFLTVALPSIGKALDTFHATKQWKAPEHFKCDGDGIPVFLGLPIRLAIDGNSVAVDCVRQLTYVFYKLEVQHADDQVAAYLNQFVNTDEDIGRFDYAASYPIRWDRFDSSVPGYNTIGSLIEEMQGLIRRVLCNTDPLDIRPCHGSGATACRTPNHKKWSSIRYYPKLDQVYDYSSHFFYSPSHLVDDLAKLEDAQHADPCARVCLVPKDSRGPRVISCEPAELMFIQQGLMRKLYETIETHPLTRGRINFTDQRINQQYARLGSINNLYATLDLKDASDRVSLDLVRRVFPPNWVEAFEACRSEFTVLPDGRKVKLNKFAPMGSACCFPVEALVFWACAVATLKNRRRLHAIRRFHERYSYQAFDAEMESCAAFELKDKQSSIGKNLGRELSIIERWNPDVLVYGDDIICDADHAHHVMVGLEAIGLLVNRDKSYVDGPFRESCGGDYHNGYDVTPVRVRKWLSSVGTGLQAGADLANELIAKFGYEEAHRVIRVIEDAVGYLYPRTDMDIPMSIRTSPSASNDAHFKRRWSSDFQRYEYRCLTLRHKVLTCREPDWFELLRKELSRDRAPAQVKYINPLAIEERNLLPGQYAVSHSARKKWAWVWLG
jgi:hypothetical protein